MLSLLKNLSYGHKLQIAEGSAAVRIPLDRSDLETWVTKSEDRHAQLSKKKIKPNKTSDEGSAKTHKGENDMTGTGEQPNPTTDCHENKDCYICINPPKIPRTTSVYYFESCCCEDSSSAALEALYQFVLQKKTVNPAILKVLKKYSPNGACNAVTIDWNLLHLAPQTQTDMADIWNKYLWLLGY